MLTRMKTVEDSLAKQVSLRQALFAYYSNTLERGVIQDSSVRTISSQSKEAESQIRVLLNQGYELKQNEEGYCYLSRGLAGGSPIQMLERKLDLKPNEPKKSDSQKSSQNSSNNSSEPSAGSSSVFCEWNAPLLEHFLKLILISYNKIYRVDYQRDEIDSEALLKLLLNVRNELLKIPPNKKPAVLIVRKVDNELIAFQLGIEKIPDRSIEQNPKHRFSVGIFSRNVVQDFSNNLRKKWKNSVAEIQLSESSQKTQHILQKFMANDFLRPNSSSDGEYEMTRLCFFSIDEANEYKETKLLYKIFKYNEVEPRDITDFRELQNEYILRAQYNLIKDASVAKAQQGFSYQEHLIMLLAYLAKGSPVDKDFSIVAEAKVPEAWNDILLEWDGHLIFFQQKHRSSYSASVDEMYSSTDMLAISGDASILKYYHAYCELKEAIFDKHHPLYRYKKHFEEKKVKFIFFSNKSLPVVNTKGKSHLKNEEDIEFKLIEPGQIPLARLERFSRVVGSQPVWQARKLDVAKLELPAGEQENLNEFLESFYFFTKQKNAEELFQYCKQVIKSSLGGFGQALLADTFSLYVHRWFAIENPENHIFDRKIITDFFDNHERYYYNLVKYSCYNYPIKEIDDLVEKHIDFLRELNCFKKIQSLSSNVLEPNLVIGCQDPFLAAVIIQKMFFAGERQVFTPFSVGLSEYEPAENGLKFAIIVGEDDRLQNVIKKINTYNKTVKPEKQIKLIQIKAASPGQVFENNLNVNAGELQKLTLSYQCLSIFKSDINFCLTDFFLFAVTPVTGGLSSSEQLKYVPQRSTEEVIVLPFDEIETVVKKNSSFSEIVAKSWFVGGNKLQCKVQIQLPDFLLENTFRLPNNPRFIWDKNNKKLYYILQDKIYFPPVEFPHSLKSVEQVNFAEIEAGIKTWIAEKKPFDKAEKDYPAVMKIILVELGFEYHGELPSREYWGRSKDKETIFYYPYGRGLSLPYVLKWNNIYSDRVIYVVEAEAACGKTWYLRSRITLNRMLPDKKIPIFISIKHMARIKNLNDPIPEFLEQSALPVHICRMARQYPQYFHLLLDGFDELPTEFSENFEQILSKMATKNYSMTITVRDYQKDKLESRTSSIMVQQRLQKFDNSEIEECFKKALIEKLPHDSLNAEVKNLREWLQNQTEVSDWLGIPFHVALVSEWYIYNRESFLNASRPSISEIYNFILQNRIERSSKRNRGDLYKVLYRLAWVQVFGAEEVFEGFNAKSYHVKKDLSFDLERTGLVKDPYVEFPEVFHRTFAEFLIAKKLSRKLIKSSCKKSQFNLSLMRLLYKTESRLIFHFFAGLLETHHADLDIPYELSPDDQSRFEQSWLVDITNCRVTHNVQRKEPNKRNIVWRKLENEENNDRESKDTSDDMNLDFFDATIEQFEKETAQLPLKDLNKGLHKEYLIKYFNVYPSLNDEQRRTLYEKLRAANIQLFLREDFPEENSFFKKYQAINEFNIESVKSTFTDLKKTSENYSWRNNNNSHAFKCWSNGGYKDSDFAMPVLDSVGSHLNIIHVFYIRLYLSFGGYSQHDDDRLKEVAIEHIKSVKDNEDLRTMFSSVLLFLGVVDDWSSKQEHPELSETVLKKITKCFEILLNSDDVNPQAKLFIKILLVDFLSYFEASCHLNYNSEKGDPSLILLFRNGFLSEINVSCGIVEQSVYQEIYNVYKTSLELHDIHRFCHFFNVWEMLIAKPSRNLSSLLGVSNPDSDSDSDDKDPNLQENKNPKKRTRTEPAVEQARVQMKEAEGSDGYSSEKNDLSDKELLHKKSKTTSSDDFSEDSSTDSISTTNDKDVSSASEAVSKEKASSKRTPEMIQDKIEEERSKRIRQDDNFGDLLEAIYNRGLGKDPKRMSEEEQVQLATVLSLKEGSQGFDLEDNRFKIELGLDCQNVLGDGFCLFRAISKQIIDRDLNKQRHPPLTLLPTTMEEVLERVAVYFNEHSQEIMDRIFPSPKREYFGTGDESEESYQKALREYIDQGERQRKLDRFRDNFYEYINLGRYNAGGQLVNAADWLPQIMSDILQIDIDIYDGQQPKRGFRTDNGHKQRIGLGRVNENHYVSLDGDLEAAWLIEQQAILRTRVNIHVDESIDDQPKQKSPTQANFLSFSRQAQQSQSHAPGNTLSNGELGSREYADKNFHLNF